MWYKTKEKLDFNKPVIAKTGDIIYLLVPTLDQNCKDYKIIGYNWLRIESGIFNSKCNFKTVDDAIESYNNCEFRNIDLFELANKEFI